MSKRFVVVGASAASLAFISKLRSIDKESEIICISGESDIPYNRCLLADYVSQDLLFEQMLLRPEEFFEKNNIDLRLNCWVTKIDIEHNHVLVGDQKVEYDYLFLGIGTRPLIPDIGIDLKAEGVFTFHTAQDAKRLSAYIDEKKPLNAVVIGAGLNGIEAVSALHDRNVTVGLVERAGHVLPAQVDRETAEYVESMLQHKGISTFLHHSVVQVCSVDGKVEGLKLDSGTTIPTDCVIITTGSVVNSELLEDTGIATQQGSIIVDGNMKTSVNNVYAGGDICIVKDAVSQQPVKSCTWADAMLQGLCAATQFSEKKRTYPGYIGLRDSKFFGNEFYACGQTVDHDASFEVVTHPGVDSLTKLYVKDNRLKGFVLIGDISKIAEYKQLYLTQKEIVID